MSAVVPQTLVAPPVLPDVQSADYQDVRDILADHPVTVGLAPMVVSSLAQQLVDALTPALHEEIGQLRERLARAQRAARMADQARAASEQTQGRLERQLRTARAEIAALRPTLDLHG